MVRRRNTKYVGLFYFLFLLKIKYIEMEEILLSSALNFILFLKNNKKIMLCDFNMI